jgi:hypothetical protein
MSARLVAGNLSLSGPLPPPHIIKPRNAGEVCQFSGAAADKATRAAAPPDPARHILSCLPGSPETISAWDNTPPHTRLGLQAFAKIGGRNGSLPAQLSA